MKAVAQVHILKRRGDSPAPRWGSRDLYSSSGEPIRTTDIRVMSKDPEFVPHRPGFIGVWRRVMENPALTARINISQPDKR